MIKSRFHPYQLILTSLLSLFFVVFVLLNKTLIIDDAYITFQYSKNFAEHFKPWYNLDPFFQGNGQTSLLWMWLLSVFNFLGFKSENAFYILNIIMGIFLISKAALLVSEEKNKLILIFKLGLSVFFTYWLALNATHGLETILATLVLYLFLKNWKSAKNPFAILLVLVRPEFGIFLLFWILNSDLGQKKEILLKLIYSGLGILIFAVFYLIFYKFYIPLPFILKSNFSTYNFLALKVFLGRLVLFSPVIFILSFQKRYLVLLPLLFLLIFYSFNINSYSSGIYIRYFFPLMTYFLLADYHIISDSKKINLIFYLILLCSIMRMIDLSSNFYQNRKDVIVDNEGFNSSYVQFAKRIKKSDKVIIMDAGNAAYFSPGTVYDGYGLNDATLLLASKNNDTVGYKNYIDERKINLISLVSKDSLKFDPRGDCDFPYKSLKLQNKKLLYRFPMDHNFYLFVYQYRD